MNDYSHPTPEAMATEYPYLSDDASGPETMADRANKRAARRNAYASGVAAERARLAGILKDLDKGDWLPGRLRALVASLSALPVEETPDPAIVGLIAPTLGSSHGCAGPLRQVLAVLDGSGEFQCGPKGKHLMLREQIRALVG